MSVRKKAPRPKTSFMTYVWTAVLGLSSIALFAGFASGSASVASPQVRVAKSTAALAPPEAPDRMPLVRMLHGMHSFEVAGDAPALESEDAVDIDKERRSSHRTKPRLAIVVLDARAGDWVVNQLLELPLPLTFSIDPSIDGARELATRASSIGHATLVQLSARIDAATPAQAQKTLRRALAQVPGASGVDLPTSGYHEVSARVAKSLSAWLMGSGLAYVAVRSLRDDRVARVARAADMPVAVRDIVIDGHENEAYVRYMLREAGDLAFRYGDVIAIAHARPETYAALRALGGRLAADGVVFAKISDIIH